MDTHTNETRTEKSDTQTLEYLTFTVAGEEYGVEIMTVREIKGWEETTRLPGAPEYMRGVINLRGAIIPIFDLRMRFGMGEAETTARHVFIVMAVGSRNVGLLVDAVSDILTIRPEDIKPAVDHAHQANPEAQQFLKGLIAVDTRMVVVLDVEHLFDAKQLEAIHTQAA
jgi:purine-binding chemotaxis protein CheW